MAHYQIDRTPVSDLGDSIVVEFDGKIVGATSYVDVMTGHAYLITITNLDGDVEISEALPKGVIPYDEESNIGAYQAWLNERHDLPA